MLKMLKMLKMLSPYIGDNLLLFLRCGTKSLYMCASDVAMRGALD